MVYNRIQHLMAGDPILFSDYFFSESFFRGNANKLFVNSLSIATFPLERGSCGVATETCYPNVLTYLFSIPTQKSFQRLHSESNN